MSALHTSLMSSFHPNGTMSLPPFILCSQLTPKRLFLGMPSNASMGARSHTPAHTTKDYIEICKDSVPNGLLGATRGASKRLVLMGLPGNSLTSTYTVLREFIGNGLLSRMRSSAAEMQQAMNAALHQSLLMLVTFTILTTQPLSSHAEELQLTPKSESLPALKGKQLQLPPLPKQFPPLREISLPKYEKIILPNGLRIFLLEDHELGLVGGQLLIRGGSKCEPAEKVGLALMTSVVQRSGGSIAHPADTLDANLEALAARIESSSNVSYMRVGFQCLSEDLSNVFSLFTEVVQEPLMPKEKLELIRSQILGVIARRQDDPVGIVSREFQKLLYGRDSAYARVPEIETVKAIERKDLRAFHQQMFRPNAGILGIWGDFDTLTVKKLIQEKFGSWKSDSSSSDGSFQDLNFVSHIPSAEPETGVSYGNPYIYTIDIPGLTQGYVRLGELGTTIMDPDVFSLDVLNGLLNGFGGLLFDEIRSREGLAYSVSGGWSPAVEHRGAFVAGGETQIKSIPNFIQAMKEVLAKVIQDAPNSERLEQAKSAALNSFVFNFSDSASQLARIMSYDLFGIDENFLFQYKKEVEQVTGDQILQAAKRHLHPTSQPILVVTDVTKMGPLLSSFNTPVVPLPLK